MTNKTKLIVSTTLALGIGAGATLAVGALTEEGPAADAPALESTAQAAEGDHDHTGAEGESYYTCPMHPSVVQDHPGACPVCGMDLIKKTKSASGMDPQELAAMGRVALSPTQRVLANVETVAVRSAGGEAGDSEIRAVGAVTYDETGLATIPSWVDGRIDKLLVRETGAVVRRGQPVMQIYSEGLVAAQEEYLVSLDSSLGSLETQTHRRLELLGMSDAQIDRVRKTGKAQTTVTAFAPNAGTITDMKVRQGQYVAEGAPLYDIADLSTVWLDAEVYEKNLGAVAVGQTVRVVADAFPGQPMEGTVSFIHPVVDTKTRTAKVRVELDNADGRLKPGMYAAAFFKKGSEGVAQDELLVPRSAVLRGGKTNSVYVEVEPNVFERREVEVGRTGGEFLVVTAGLAAGEEVAYRGGFLLDSEVQLNSFGGAAAGGHGGHGGHGGESGDGAKAGGEHADHPELTHADISKEGKEFDPAIPADAVPEGAWYCEMNGESHWVQHSEGDGECPVCGMFLKQKKADGGGHADAADQAHAGHDMPARDHAAGSTKEAK